MQYTYTTLLASCQNYFIDSSTQYITEFPNLVQLSEMRIIKDLNLTVFDTSVTGIMTLGTQSLTMPADFITVQDLFVVVNSNRVYLQPRSKSYLDQYWPDYTQTDQPIYYAVDTTTAFQLAPTPDENYTYQLNYVARPLPMTSINPTTWIGNKLGELLLYATLVNSALYFREDPATENGMIAAWEKAYEIAAAQAKNELQALTSAKDNVLNKITTTQS